jgi:hypothetical protein
VGILMTVLQGMRTRRCRFAYLLYYVSQNSVFSCPVW